MDEMTPVLADQKKEETSTMVKWRFYLSSEQAWDAMYEACGQAKKFIHFEQFIFMPDKIGSKFAELFERKASEGVDVKLLADSGGSYSFFLSSLPKRMKSRGVQVEFFNKISPWRIQNLRLWFFRNHRKILVVDGNKGYLGGVGIGDFLFGWRDTHVELVGDIVQEIESAFERMWQITVNEKFISSPVPRLLKSGFSLLTNSPHNRQRFIYRRFLDMIKGAKKSIYASTPYFVPDTRIFRALRRAARRGVDVKIMLPLHSDHPYVDWGSHYHFTKALRSGIKIFNYNSMIHSKSIVVDDDWASVGSANMDNYSFFFNYEANIACTDKKFIEEIKSHFYEDFIKCEEIKLSQWIKRNPIDKILEFILTPFIRFL